MAVIEINWNPGRGQLRWFAALWFPLAATALGWFLWRTAGDTAGEWAWGIGAALAVAANTSLSVARAIYVALMVATSPIGIVVAYVMLAFVFYLLLTPIGVLSRLVRRDPMRRSEPPGDSHFEDCHRDRTLDRYFRQY